MQNPLSINCKNCGSPVGFNIEKGEYLCPYCGRSEGVKEATDNFVEFKKLNANDRVRLQSNDRIYSCPNCGADVLFPEGEESETCGFCSGKLIRREFEEQRDFPEMLIPFVLTKDEAIEQLNKLIAKYSGKEIVEIEILKNNMDKIEGYYLPYKLVRGPVAGNVRRERSYKQYHARGFVEMSLVNTSKQMDNEVLDMIEPFNVESFVPFEHGFIAGHKVKFSDLSPSKTQRRTLKEVGKSFTPYIKKELKTEGFRVDLYSEDLIEVPVLLPVYIIKTDTIFACVNGQTGKVAIDCNYEEPAGKRWLLEPSILTAVCTLSLSSLFHFALAPVLLNLAVFALIFFTAFSKNRMKTYKKRIVAGDDSKAHRENGNLVVETNPVFRNPYSCKPIFYELINGCYKDVEIRFYSFGRILGMLIKFLLILFAPVGVAGLISLIKTGGIASLNFTGGMAWFCLICMMSVLYYIVGVRTDIYNHPILYEIIPNGKKKRIRNTKQTRMTILGVFHYRNRRLTLSDMGSGIVMVFLMIAFIAFIFCGSVVAMVM